MTPTRLVIDGQPLVAAAAAIFNIEFRHLAN